VERGRLVHHRLVRDAAPSSGLAEALGLDRGSLKKILVGLLVLLMVTGALGFLLRAPLATFSLAMVERFGLPGLFTGVMVIDAWVLPPLTHEPLLLFAYAGGVDPWQVFAIASAASVCAGPLGYLLGRLFGRIERVQGRLNKTALQALMRERGAVVVAAAAITPIPFAVTTWLAGAVQTPFVPFLLACLVRVLKVAVYFGLIVAGWSISG
jgi:membrane protein YqaA with SNARE-associated domain